MELLGRLLGRFTALHPGFVGEVAQAIDIAAGLSILTVIESADEVTVFVSPVNRSARVLPLVEWDSAMNILDG